MPEIVADGQPFETPIGAATEGYAQTPPSLGGFMGAVIGGGPTEYLSRAAVRGTQADASAFDRYLASIGQEEAGAAAMVPAEPETSPILAPEEYNQRFAPVGPDGKQVSLGDQPMSEGLAQIIGQQKSDALEREGIQARFANAHAWPVTFAAGAVAQLADPLNLSLSFIPPLGEGSITAALGGGLAARIAARAGAGALAGAAAQVPISLLQAGLAPEEASDFGLRDALRQVAYGAAGYAALHAGFGTIGDILGRRASEAVAGEARATTTGELAPILTADAPTTHAALSAATGEIADGKPVDVAPLFPAKAPGEAPNTFRTTITINGEPTVIEGPTRTPPDVAAFAEEQQRLDRDGYAPGMAPDEFAAAQDAVYGKPEAEPGAPPLRDYEFNQERDITTPQESAGEPQPASATGAAGTPEPRAPTSAAEPATAVTEASSLVRPVDPEIAEAEQQLALAPQEGLTAEDHAELASTADALKDAEDKSAGYEAAGQCLAGSGVA